MPIPGVTVLIKGSNQGTLTDFDGNYFLDSVDPKDVIIFSLTGIMKNHFGGLNRSKTKGNGKRGYQKVLKFPGAPNGARKVPKTCILTKISFNFGSDGFHFSSGGFHFWFRWFFMIFI